LRSDCPESRSSPGLDDDCSWAAAVARREPPPDTIDNDRGVIGPGQLWTFIATGYLFKMAAALLDTIPFYLGTAWLRRYLHVEDEIP